MTGSTAALIDNIYTNEMSVNIEPGILINDISDHLPILCMVDYIFPKKNMYGNEMMKMLINI